MESNPPQQVQEPTAAEKRDPAKLSLRKGDAEKEDAEERLGPTGSIVTTLSDTISTVITGSKWVWAGIESLATRLYYKNKRLRQYRKWFKAGKSHLDIDDYTGTTTEKGYYNYLYHRAHPNGDYYMG
uniref:Uncharacterized protein n=1 Tax=Peronospora matthiolae TaxID=2874970 RepID=A0AAV1USN6_9STRA